MASNDSQHSTLLQRWRAAYEAQAQADEYQEWVIDYEHHDEPLDACRDRLTKTVRLVSLLVAHRLCDNSEDTEGVAAFLRKQTYRRCESSARYVVYFCGSPVQDVEIFVDQLQEIDLADIFNDVGFADVGVALRESCQELGNGEATALEKAVLADFQFDYGEDEISIVFDRSGNGVFATVRE